MPEVNVHTWAMFPALGAQYNTVVNSPWRWAPVVVVLWGRSTIGLSVSPSTGTAAAAHEGVSWGERPALTVSACSTVIHVIRFVTIPWWWRCAVAITVWITHVPRICITLSETHKGFLPTSWCNVSVAIVTLWESSVHIPTVLKVAILKSTILITTFLEPTVLKASTGKSTVTVSSVIKTPVGKATVRISSALKASVWETLSSIVITPPSWLRSPEKRTRESVSSWKHFQRKKPNIQTNPPTCKMKLR